MSRLKELIQEYCPDGVEYRRLGDVAKIERGNGLQKKDFVENNSACPCIHYGQIYTYYSLHGIATDHAITYVSDTVYKKNIKAKPCDIIMAVTSENVEDVCKCVVWQGDKDIAVSGHTAIIRSDILDPKFLAYYFYSSLFYTQKLKLVHGTKVIEVTPAKMNDVEIPIPPLPVQQEIVRILDEYSEAEQEFKKQLEQELEQRKKQYGNYRDELLNGNFRTLKLDEICQIVDCPHSSPKWKEAGIPVIRNYNLVNGHIDMTNLSYVDESEYIERVKRIVPRKDDILFSREAPIGNVGIVPDNFKCCQGQRVVLLRPDNHVVRSEFLIYALQGSFVKNQIAQVEKIGATVSNFNISDLKQLKVKVPNLNDQDYIVSVLDNFNSICTSLTSGLPSEISLRKKQYEYYRDKLLSFKRTDNR